MIKEIQQAVLGNLSSNISLKGIAANSPQTSFVVADSAEFVESAVVVLLDVTIR